MVTNHLSGDRCRGGVGGSSLEADGGDSNEADLGTRILKARDIARYSEIQRDIADSDEADLGYSIDTASSN